jgi:LCP family protein required for cell wall assembly
MWAGSKYFSGNRAKGQTPQIKFNCGKLVNNKLLKSHMDNKREQKPSKSLAKTLASKRVFIGLLIAFAITGVLASFLAYSTVRSMVSEWNLTDLEGFSLLNNPTAEPGAPTPDRTLPLQPSSGPTPQPWDGASRVTILVMGLDYRDWEENQGAPRTDTMILFTIDPLSGTGGMLSIPRDLWVNIPGFEPNKINTAYRFGEVYKLPGGGPGLAINTVEGLLGVPINFYALIDFYAFERFIDEIGGIEIEVPEEIKVDPLGPGNTVILEQGTHTIGGDVALAYARARNTEGGDFDRAQRQQQVTFAIRRQILQLDQLPVLISKAPVLYQEIASGVHTNLTLEQAIKLGVLAQQIDRENIQQGVIGPPEHVTFGISPDGLDILKPVPDKIRILRDEIFTTDTLSSPAANTSDLKALVQEENARVSVLNGTFTAGLAAASTEFLSEQGLNITVTDNARQAYNFTTLIVYSGKPYTIEYLAEMMEIASTRIFFSYDPTSEVDVEINLGEDWVGKLP